MNTLRSLVSAFVMRQTFTLAANEAAPVPAANEGVVAGSFSIEQKDGFTIPYGEYPHSAGLQIFDKASAEAMANEMTSLLGNLKRGFKGVPVYAGHPDHHDMKIRAQFPDRRARGWVKEIVANEDHAKFIVAWNELGKTEVDDAQWAAPSPYWLMQQLPGLKARPVKLVSIALTNQPNIPTPPLIAANDEGASSDIQHAASSIQHPASNIQHPDITMNIDLNKLTAALIEAGIIKDGDEEATILSSIGSLARELQWARESKQRMELEAAEMKAKLGDAAANDADHAALLQCLLSRCEVLAANEASANELQSQLTAANERASAFEALAKKARAAHVAAELKRLITAANISASEAETQRLLLLAAANEDEFNSLLTPLTTKKTTLQTSTQVAHDLAGQRGVLAANEAERSTNRVKLVQQHLQAITQGKPHTQDQYDAAWQKARAEKPELF